MTDPTPTPLALPRAHILSYVTTIATPNRVRLITARAVIIVGLLSIVIAIFALCLTIRILDERDFFTEYSTTPLSRWPQEFGGDALVLPLIFLLMLTTSVTSFACAGPIKRGLKFACWLELAALALVNITLLGIAALLGGLFLVLGLGFGQARGDYPMLLWLLVPAAMVVIILLLGDLIGFLRWIAKNPIQEKPPVPFLPIAPPKPPR